MSLQRGPLNEDDLYLKSSILHQWLFGYEIPDTIILLRKDGNVWILATKKKCDFVRPAVTNIPEKSSIKAIHLIIGSKESNETNYDTLWTEVMASRVSDDKRSIGLLLKEGEMNMTGKGIIGPWGKKLLDESTSDDAKVTLVDVLPGLSFAMSIKDETELDLIKKSSVLSNKVMKHGYVKRMEEVIDSEETIKHEDLATYVEEILENPSKISLKVPKEDVQSCYFPIIQSGGKYDLKVSAQSTSDALTHDVIIVSLGARYRNYCSNIARTFFVDPPKKVSEIYDILLLMQDACLAAMKPGNQLKSVYRAAVEFLEKSSGFEYLVKHLPKNLGFLIGLDFRESVMLLTAKNSVALKQGMVFCLSVSFQNLDLSEVDTANTPSKCPVSPFCYLFTKKAPQLSSFFSFVFEGKKTQNVRSTNI